MRESCRARAASPGGATASLWRLTLRDAGATFEVQARALVNAAGPWVRSVLDRELRIRTPGAIRLVKGSHIVVPRLHDRAHAYILQNPDKRVVFMIPYEERFTEIGTTDVVVADPDEPARISRDETDYLCAAASRYASRPVTPGDVAWTWSGVRPLYDDGSAEPSEVTRDYHLVVDADGPPLLSVFGGKLTTYRKLAEAALERLDAWFPDRRRWTATAPLPGGDFGGESLAEVMRAYRARYPKLDPRWLERLVRRHGLCTAEILGDAREPADLGESFGGGLYERELDHLVEREWAREPEDVLWRRTKCGLHMSVAERERLAEFMSVQA